MSATINTRGPTWRTPAANLAGDATSVAASATISIVSDTAGTSLSIESLSHNRMGPFL